MADVAELGRLVKRKHPGSYDALPDAELGARVKAKYPAYANFTDLPAASTAVAEPPTEPAPQMLSAHTPAQIESQAERDRPELVRIPIAAARGAALGLPDIPVPPGQERTFGGLALGAVPGLRRMAKSLPAPVTKAERIASGVGGGVAFGAQAAGVAATLPAAGVAATTALAGRFLTAAVPAALQRGSLKDRAINTLVMGTMGTLGIPVSNTVTRAILGRAAKEAPDLIRAGIAAGRAAEAEALAGPLTASARQAAQLGEAAKRKVIDEGLANLARTIYRAQQIAHAAVAFVGFGAAAPHLEAALHRATGEKVEGPTLEEMIEGMVGLGIVGVVLGAAGRAGRGPRGPGGGVEPPRSTPEEAAGGRPTPPPSLPPGPESAAHAEAGMAPPAEGRPGSRAVPLSGQHVRIANGILAGLNATERNPLDMGRAQRQAAQERFYALLGDNQNPTDGDIRSAASKARARTKGAWENYQAVRDPGAPNVLERRNADETTRELLQTLAGRPITLEVGLPGPGGMPVKQVVSGVIVNAVNFPYTGLQQKTRILLQDTQNGRINALYFGDVADLRKAIRPNPPAAGEAKPSMAPEPGKMSLEGAALATQPGLFGAPTAPAPAPAAKPKPAKPSPLPQEPLALPEAPAPVAAAPAPPAPKPAAPAPTAAAPQPSGTFDEHFMALVKRGRSPEDARAEAETLSGGSAPRGFDAEARAKAVLHRAAEAAGQGSLFGGGETVPVPPAPAPPSPAPGRAAGGGLVPEPPGQGALGKPESVDARWNRLSSEIHAAVQGGRGFQLRTQYRAIQYSNPADVKMGSDGRLRVRQGKEWLHLTGPQVESIADQLGLSVLGKLKPTAVPVEVQPSPAMRKAADEMGTIGPVRVVPAAPAAPALASGAATMRAQSIHFHEPFQQRDTERGVIDQEHVQALVKRHGGYSAEEMAKAPVTVWRDTKGEVGPAGRVYVLSGHHRTYIAQHEWTLGEHGLYDATSTSDREIPVVFHEGDYQSALTEAETSNLKGKVNTLSEQAGVVGRLKARGLSDQRIADLAAGGKPERARDLLALSSIDEALRRQYFGEKGLPLNVGAYIGAFIQEYRVHPEHQRPWLEQLADGRLKGLEDLRAVVEPYLKILKAANQTNLLSQLDMGPAAIPPAAALSYLNRAFLAVDRAKRSAQVSVRVSKKDAQRTGAPLAVAAARIMLDIHQKELAKAIAIRSEVEARAQKEIAEATRTGGNIIDALHAISKWVDEKMGPEAPQDWGGGVSFMGTGEAGRWLGGVIQRGVREAVRRTTRETGNKADVRIVDSKSGAVRDKLKPYEVMDDPFVDSWVARGLGRLGLTGLSQVADPSISHGWMVAGARQAQITELYERAVEQALGTPEAIRFFSDPLQEVLLFEAMESGDASKLPPEFRAVVGRFRAVSDLVYQADAQHATEMGRKIPGYIKNYAAHLTIGEPMQTVSELYELLSGRKVSEMAEPELRDLRNRFLEERTNFPNFERRYLVALRARMFASARTIAIDEFMRSVVRPYFESPDVLNGKGDALAQANATKALLIAGLFRKKGRFVAAHEDGVRRWFFANLTGGIQARELAGLAKELKIEPQSWKLAGFKVGAYVPDDVKPLMPVGWERVGTVAGGAYWVGPKGMPTDARTPTPKAWLEAFEDLTTDKLARILGHLNEPAALRRHQAKVNDKIQRLYDNPIDVVMARFTGNQSAALLGWNIGFNTRNAIDGITQTYIEFGLRATLDGIWRSSLAYSNATVRAAVQSRLLKKMVDGLAAQGYLTPEQAAQARTMVPLLRDELYAQATGVHQGELHEIYERWEDIAEGRDPKVMAALRLITPRGLMRLTEPFARTLSILAADSYARRTMGLENQTAEVYEATEAGKNALRDEMIAAVRDPLSAESQAMIGVGRTQFIYDIYDQPAWMQGPFNKLIWQFATWPFVNAIKMQLRPGEAFSRAPAAAAFKAPFVRGRGRGRSPFERWLDKGGAGFSTRHNAAKFIRSQMIAAILLAAAQETGINVAVLAPSPYLWAALLILHTLMPDSKRLKKWLSTEQYALGGFTRGLPFGPTISAGLAAFSGDAFRGARAAFEKDGDWRHWMPTRMGDFFLDQVRNQFVAGKAQIVRILQSNPEWYEHLPELYKALGIKTVMKNPTPGAIARKQLGMQTEDEAKRQRRRLPK